LKKRGGAEAKEMGGLYKAKLEIKGLERENPWQPPVPVRKRGGGAGEALFGGNGGRYL